MGVTMYEKFVRERITQLRLQKNVSEYQMSYDLGHSRGYIYNISSGNALPPLKELFAICEYFGITPKEFFDVENRVPLLSQRTASALSSLRKEDAELIENLVGRLSEK